MEESRSTLGRWAVYIAVLMIVLTAGAFYGRPYVAAYFKSKGAAALTKEDFSSAKTYFERARYFSTRDPEIYYYLGRVALGKVAAGEPVIYPDADYTKVIAAYERAIGYDLKINNAGFYSQALNDLGFSYWNEKNYTKAVEYYLKRIEAVPNRSFASRYFVALDYFDRSNKPEEALQILLPAFEIDTESLTDDASTIYQGSLYRMQTLATRLYSYFSNASSTKVFASAAIKSAGGNTDRDVQIAHLLLAKALIQEKNSPKALEEYHKADVLAETVFSKKNVHQCFLGNLYYLDGKYTAAITTASEGVANVKIFDYPKSICLETLARSYLAKKDTKNAKQYLRQYLDETAKFAEKNIFVMRNREEFRKLLETL